MCCKEYILEDSPKMVLGGPYNGAMFKPATDDNWSATMFRTGEDVKRGDLWCPRCSGKFLGDRGELLTEHGLVMEGQRTVDPTISIIHQEGHAKGMLAHIKPSQELMDRAQIPPKEEVEKVAAEIGKIACPKCGKEYTDSDAGRLWYDRHIAKCEG